MADSGFNITFSKETSECLVGLAKVRNKSIQDLAEKLMQQAIEFEEDTILVERAMERDVPGVEEVDDSEEIWK
ncbi:hypothetical protein [Candidatus Wolbachia massiliensis]|uniref:CopG family transcriptional regulator n=1 Tax=Candidatus Wolbachia massiliensis TaxID=1845000 RepID=A0A7L7YR13_9RICK|nr:hypothetical protein [Candidatus Wolbachia massiliensis]QOD38196.1 hypothetical protein ID128_05375 [Candidatus Wolbachia massiliensis]